MKTPGLWVLLCLSSTVVAACTVPGTSASSGSSSGDASTSSSNAAASSSGGTSSSGGSSSGGTSSSGGGAACDSLADYLQNTAWDPVFSKCVACHVAGGPADGTRYILKDTAAPDYLFLNLGVIRSAGALMQDGQPLMVQKATAAVPHAGGQQVVPGSEAENILRTTITRAVAAGDCSHDPASQFAGVTLHSPYGTLRKAALQLVGRPPLPEEIALVDSTGIPALDPILDTMMSQEAFYERLREVFSDVLLTDGFRANSANTNTANIINNEYHPATVDYFGGENWDWRSWPNGEGIKLVEALAREPVEFAVQATRNNRSLAEMVTAKHRLLNAYSARFLGVPYKGFMPGTPFQDIPNPTEMVPVDSVPSVNEANGQGEYAGVLTTTAWLLRYPSSPTNYNRKRARFTLKYFMDFDIMKTAPRIDAAAVDLSDYPTRRNMQCTGCHTQIDPLAGAYMNQDECGYEATVYYRTTGKNGECNNDTGWVLPDHMFPAGVGPGPENEFTVMQRPKALEVLGAHIAGQTAFARSMVTHLYTALLGRPLLAAPSDASIPGYANLDAAHTAEQAELARLTALFQAQGLLVKPLVKEIVKSVAFRAADADAADRLELSGLGGGALTTPEILDRKILATTGVRWRRHLYAVASNTGYQRLGKHDGSQDAYLLQREELKTLYGGMDGTFDGVKVRQRLPSTLTAAIVEHMALEVSCEATAQDFDKPAATRSLFPHAETTLLPSGSINAPNQAGIVLTLQHLHERLLGERLPAFDPEIVASYGLLVGAQQDGLAQITAGTASPHLDRPCAHDMDLATGVPITNGTVEDPQYIIRAWQVVVAAMLMDINFIFEP